MIEAAQSNWHDLNQRYLSAVLDELRLRIDPESGSEIGNKFSSEALLGQMPVPPAIETLREMFGLSDFEREVLLLCAGVELDGGFSTSVARISGRDAYTAPTFGLAMSILDSPHWTALTPAGPLRQWRLIELSDAPALTAAPLRISERVLHYLTGCRYLDEQLAGLVELLEPGQRLVDSYANLANEIARAWAHDQSEERMPVIQIISADQECAVAVAVEAMSLMGLQAAAMQRESVPGDVRHREELARLWERESVLGSRVLILDCLASDDLIPGTEQAATRFIERVASPIVTLSRQPIPLRRHSLRFDVAVLDRSEREALWRDSLGDVVSHMNGTVSRLAEQFQLDAGSIRRIARDLSTQIDATDHRPLPDLLWDLCRKHARPRLDRLAQRIEPGARWDDLVLPAPQRQMLREIAMHVRHRHHVYTDWGFRGKGTRGLGISALFSGPSGTGKTMAAEVLASELNLDLYRIDLSQVVNKYIGETEKNLARLFDAAEGCGVILLFDEADALFGKRSEVRDSHDRYANIEVSYLLQRMETYNGLAILTTNLKSALDQAFLRRIRFVVQFPFPDAPARAEIWRRMFPPETPLSGVDADKLSRLGLAGGNIRNIALNAAFLAAESGGPVGMHHLLQSTRSEVAKLERPLSEAEIRGWID
jgi:hypothetical protein